MPSYIYCVLVKGTLRKSPGPASELKHHTTALITSTASGLHANTSCTLPFNIWKAAITPIAAPLRHMASTDLENLIKALHSRSNPMGPLDFSEAPVKLCGAPVDYRCCSSSAPLVQMQQDGYCHGEPVHPCRSHKS